MCFHCFPTIGIASGFKANLRNSGFFLAPGISIPRIRNFLSLLILILGIRFFISGLLSPGFSRNPQYPRFKFFRDSFLGYYENRKSPGIRLKNPQITEKCRIPGIEILRLENFPIPESFRKSL